YDAAAAFAREVRLGFRSLLRARGMAATVIVTLALGIGANAAVYSVVRDVLLRPLANDDAERLVYVRQTALGLNGANATFSMAAIRDIKARSKTISAFGDFSTIDFTLVGLGDPRVVKAGVVSGSYFDVMGLHPVLGRLLGPADDGESASGAVVLTHRFWTSSLNADPSVVGETIQLGSRSATIVGVLEPSVPYPADTEIIANMVTSPHHLSATMVTERTHRMTELFGRLMPGASVESARSELKAIHAALMRAHPEAYPSNARMQLSVTPLREQITAPARTVLLVLLAASAIVFVIACSNVANLILARSVRREGELAVRAALGASRAALRRTLLAESVVLCAAGAVLGVLLAQPFVAIVSRFAARFSVRALEVTVDSSLLWVGVGLAMVAAVLLAYVPRLPSSDARHGGRLAAGSFRITPGTNRRLRLFAVAQIAFSFVLLSGAAALLAALAALQTSPTGYENLHQVLAVDIPTGIRRDAQVLDFYREVTRRVSRLPGVKGVAIGSSVPWRDAGRFGPGFRFTVEGHSLADGEEQPHGRMRFVAPGFFSVLGVPLLAGRDFTAADDGESENVVIVSQSVAKRMFPGGDALNRKFWWTDPFFGEPEPRRIVGIVADVDDENVVRGPALTIYHPIEQMGIAGRLFVHTAGDPYALVPPITRVIRELAPRQPVERAATLGDVRAEVLAPERLNAFVLSGFAGVALTIAVVGVAGVLAFSVSARTREFGVWLAVGST
ncbi:MAG TPA: ABC transporter permease, partial [Woeseiaceae bacterium]|nr:ABC transporter permease [Woeseiaceae bacterium]